MTGILSKKGQRDHSPEKRRSWVGRCNQLMHLFFFSNGALTIMILGGICLLLCLEGLPTFRLISLSDFLLGTVWNPTGYHEAQFGIVSLVISTLMTTMGAMLITIPFGLGCAAYLAEVAGERTRELLKPFIELLASIPSVVIGFLGIVATGPLIASLFGRPNGLNAMNGSLLLSLMALPTVVSLSEDALSAVPKSYRDASLALGATRWQTLRKTVFPAAFSGVTASIMLGMGRAIGETMTVLMATGNATALPGGFLDSVRTMTATIAIELGEAPFDTVHYHALFAVGLALFAFTFTINLSSDLILHRYRKTVE